MTLFCVISNTELSTQLARGRCVASATAAAAVSVSLAGAAPMSTSHLPVISSAKRDVSGLRNHVRRTQNCRNFRIYGPTVADCCDERLQYGEPYTCESTIYDLGLIQKRGCQIFPSAQSCMICRSIHTAIRISGCLLVTCLMPAAATTTRHDACWQEAGLRTDAQSSVATARLG